MGVLLVGLLVSEVFDGLGAEELEVATLEVVLLAVDDGGGVVMGA